MFPPPIRPIQSSGEVRRVDEVTPVKHVVERAPSSLLPYEEPVRITIGVEARRLAGSSERAAAEEADDRQGLFTEEAIDSEGRPVNADISFERVFASKTSARASVNPVDDNPQSLANRALRAARFTSGPVFSAAEGDEEVALSWSPDETTKVPFEVLQRAVAQAIIDESEADFLPEPASYEPGKPVFLPPENGGEPFGRAVPFEFGASNAEGAGKFSQPLSSEDAESVLSELTWTLPGTKPETTEAVQ